MPATVSVRSIEDPTRAAPYPAAVLVDPASGRPAGISTGGAINILQGLGDGVLLQLEANTPQTVQLPANGGAISLVSSVPAIFRLGIGSELSIGPFDTNIHFIGAERMEFLVGNAQALVIFPMEDGYAGISSLGAPPVYVDEDEEI